MSCGAPLVSILIPCHNAEAWLASTLESALAQTHRPCEIIVIDDGSTDRSLAIATGYKARGVRLASQPALGASAARNHAYRLASGDWIQYLDADDLLAPDKIEIQLNRLRSAGPGHIASGEWARFVNNPAEARFDPQPNWRDLSGLEFQLLHAEGGWMMQPAAWLCPRSILEQAGPWDENLSLNDDGEYFSRVMLRASGILFCPGARVYYRSGTNASLSAQKSRRALRSLFTATELMCQRMRTTAGDSPRSRHAAAQAWQTVMWECWPHHPELSREAERRRDELGGAPTPLPQGPVFRRAARLIGWRCAKTLRDRILNQRPVAIR